MHARQLTFEPRCSSDPIQGRMSLHSHLRRLASIPCSFFHLMDVIDWLECDSCTIRLVCACASPRADCSSQPVASSGFKSPIPMSLPLPLSLILLLFLLVSSVALMIGRRRIGRFGWCRSVLCLSRDGDAGAQHSRRLHLSIPFGPRFFLAAHSQRV